MSKKQYAALAELPSKISQLELDVELTEDPKTTKITLYANNWVNNTQTAVIPGIIAEESEQAIWIHPVYNEINIEAINEHKVIGLAQGKNCITFGCETAPSVDVQFYIKWQNIDFINHSSGESIDEIIVSAEGIGF